MQYEEIISKLTLAEKCGILSGKDVWHTREVPGAQIPSIMLSDGPSGLRKQEGEGDHLGLNASVKATCFPSAATVANSWDLELAEKVGEALGREAAAKEVGVLLGPGLNVKRSRGKNGGRLYPGHPVHGHQRVPEAFCCQRAGNAPHGQRFRCG